MKNKFNLLISTAITITMILSGCATETPDATEATEFLNDETGIAATTGDSTDDSASADQSIIIVDKLIEPLLEDEIADNTRSAAEIVDADADASDSAATTNNTAATDSAAATDSESTDGDKSESQSDAGADSSSEDSSKSGSSTETKESDATAEKVSSEETGKSDSAATAKSTDKSKSKKSTSKKNSDTADKSDSSSAEKSESSDDKKKKEDDKVEIVFFGDSQIAGGRKDQTDIATYVGNRVPNSVVYNLGIGGTTGSVEASTSEIDPSKLHSTSFLGMTYCLAGESDREATLANNPDVLETMNKVDPEKVDYYFIEYGTNDFINNVPLDMSMYATDGEQFHAFYNAMCKGIDVLSEISPDAQFIIMTPFYGIYVADDGSYIGDSYIVSNGTGTLADYARKAINVSEDRELYYFDGMFISKCDLYLDTADKYLLDNLHLNVTGRQIMGRLLAHYVNYLEANEPFAYLDSDFIKVAEFDPDEDYRLDEHVMKENYPESWAKYIKGVYPLAQPSKEALEKYGDN